MAMPAICWSRSNKPKPGLEKGGKSKKMKIDREVRMVAEDGEKYGKR